MRISFGYDVHQLVEGRPLILGGVDIPFEKGCLGHSDADVLLHAICDALLGAAGLGDIGVHFPDTSDVFRGVSSLLLLKEVGQKINRAGYRISNIDSTLVLQRPKIMTRVPEMIANIVGCLAVDNRQISIKATTSEGLGFVGTGDGVVAYAVAALEDL